MKATWAQVDGIGRALFKDPATDTGKVKKSAKGLLRVEKEGNDFVLYDNQAEFNPGSGMQLVFQDGTLHNEETFAVIKARNLASL